MIKIYNCKKEATTSLKGATEAVQGIIGNIKKLLMLTLGMKGELVVVMDQLIAVLSERLFYVLTVGS